MTASSTDTKRQFDWLTPDPEKGKGSIGTGVRAKPLAPEQWEEFQEIAAIMGEIRPWIIDFLTLEKDYREVESLKDELHSQFSAVPHPALDDAVVAVETFVTVQRALSNFLSSANAFREKARNRLMRRYGRESLQVRGFESAILEVKINAFAFRFLRFLSNYSLHNENPINAIPVSGARDDNDELALSVRVEIKRDIILRNLKPTMRKQDKELISLHDEIMAQPEAIPLLPLAEEYMKQHGKLFHVIIASHQDRLARFSRYAQAVLQSAVQPNDAKPVIWEGADPPDGIAAVKIYAFSFDEFELLIKTLERWQQAES